MDSDRKPSPVGDAPVGIAAASSTAPARRPGVLTQAVDGNTVLVDTARNRIFELNETAGTLWRLLDGVADRAALVAALTERYDAPADLIRDEVATTLDTLAAHGLLASHPGE